MTTNKDRWLIYSAALLRGLAAGAISVLAAVWLAKRGFDDAAIGLVLSAGFAGVLAGTVYVTYFADRVGRRRSLVLLALLAAIGGALLVIADNVWTVGLAAFFGMLNTQGSHRRGSAGRAASALNGDPSYCRHGAAGATRPRRRSA